MGQLWQESITFKMFGTFRAAAAAAAAAAC